MLFSNKYLEGDEPSHKVVVTGIGMVTALGTNTTENAAGFRNGRIGLQPVTLFDTSDQRVQQAGQVTLPDHLPVTALPERTTNRLDRATKLLLLAADECLRSAGWDEPRLDCAVSIGTSSGGMSSGEQFFRGLEGERSSRIQRQQVAQYSAHRQIRILFDAYQINGTPLISSNACASGCNAIGEAWRMIRTGACRRVLAGGYDALSKLVFAGFDSLQALSTSTPMPFDVNRDGLALGEGAALLALEDSEEAQQRGAPILAEITGYAATTDLHHLTQPAPDGHAARWCMTHACRHAGIEPGDVDYVNAHGTGTPLNDSAELAAINDWAQAAAENIIVSSTKASVGHLLGAAGAIETALCVTAIEGGWLPPNANLHDPEPDANFQLPTQPQDADLTHCLSNSFGFGGSNASVVISKP